MIKTIEQNNKKYFVYLRQSKKGNSEYTFELQFETIKQFASQRGIFIDETGNLIKQEDVSAYEGNRQKFDEMVKELENDGKKPLEKQIYGGILFFNVSRIARNSEDFLKIEKLMKLGYKMFSAMENIIDSASGMYFFRMIQIESIYYSDRQSSKSQSYNLHIISREPRKSTGGNGISYGYNIKNQEISIHPVNSLIVKRIFELRSEGKGNSIIEDILIKEFAKVVDNYNGNQGGSILLKNNNHISDDTEVETEDMNVAYDGEQLITIDYNMRASIPNAKKISDIISGRFSIQYNGKRRCKFILNFDEDISIYNQFIKSKAFPFKFLNGDKFKKGENTVIVDVPELRIIENKLYEKIISNKITKERIEGGHIYKGIAFCKCGGRMKSKIEGKLGKVYYQCENALKKDNLTCKNTTRITENEINIFVQTRIFSYLELKEGTKEFENCIKDLQTIRTENLKNRLKTEIGSLSKFKTILKTAKDANIHEEYTDKIDEKTILVENLKEEIIEIEDGAKLDFINFADKFETFLSLDKEEQTKLIHKVFKWIQMDEDHTEEYRYNNIHNKRSIQYQKITSFELKPYFQYLFDMNYSHE